MKNIGISIILAIMLLISNPIPSQAYTTDLNNLSISELKELRNDIDQVIKEKELASQEDRNEMDKDTLFFSLGLLGTIMLIPISVVVIENIGSKRYD